MLFIYLDTDNAENGRIFEFFGLTESDFPTVRFIKLGDDMLKFKPDSADLSTAAIKSFVSDAVSGKLKVP